MRVRAASAALVLVATTAAGGMTHHAAPRALEAVCRGCVRGPELLRQLRTGPTIASLAVAPRRLPNSGGNVVISVRTRHAVLCTVTGQTSPHSSSVRFGEMNCAPGHAKLRFRVADNSYPRQETLHFRVRAADGKGHSVVRAASLVEAANNPSPSGPPGPVPTPTPPTLVVSSVTLPAALVGAGYQTTLVAANGAPPYTWQLTSGALPPGLALTPDGALAGTPTSTGDFTFAVAVADSTSATATASLTIDVSATPLPVLTATSDNWSGYALTGGPFTAVSASFNVPKLAPSRGISTTSEWVGIDGVGNTSLIQAGVEEKYNPGGEGVLTFAWWEILPAPETPVFGLGVIPGDEVMVAINQVSAGLWDITVADDTSNQSSTLQIKYSGPGASAEWVVEAPTDLAADQIETLGKYSPTVTFTSPQYAGHAGSLTAVSMEQAGTVVSVPSPMDAKGFSVAYGATPPPPP